MHVMIEITTRIAVINLAQITLTRMAERRMPYIVPQRNRFDKISVQPQQATDPLRNTIHQLNMKAAAANVVVFNKRENLRLIGITVIRWHIDDFLYVARKRWTRKRGFIMRIRFAALHRFIGRSIRMRAPVRPISTNRLFNFGFKR